MARFKFLHNQDSPTIDNTTFDSDSNDIQLVSGKRLVMLFTNFVKNKYFHHKSDTNVGVMEFKYFFLSYTGDFPFVPSNQTEYEFTNDGSYDYCNTLTSFDLGTCLAVKINGVSKYIATMDENGRCTITLNKTNSNGGILDSVSIDGTSYDVSGDTITINKSSLHNDTVVVVSSYTVLTPTISVNVPSTNITSTSAKYYASYANVTDTSNCVFKLKKSTDTSWRTISSINATPNGFNYTDVSLSPSTTYEIKACVGDIESSVVTFTTSAPTYTYSLTARNINYSDTAITVSASRNDGNNCAGLYVSINNGTKVVLDANGSHTFSVSANTQYTQKTHTIRLYETSTSTTALASKNVTQSAAPRPADCYYMTASAAPSDFNVSVSDVTEWSNNQTVTFNSKYIYIYILTSRLSGCTIENTGFAGDYLIQSGVSANTSLTFDSLTYTIGSGTYTLAKYTPRTIDRKEYKLTF